MSEDKERAEIIRERLRVKELSNPSSSIKGGGLFDLIGSLNWKGTAIIILIIIIVFVVVSILIPK